uniref:Uncharacterized protein n=1 Tax=Pyrodinium bahamense TaxID=73915 RepID=A0A7S0FG23_9DINO
MDHHGPSACGLKCRAGADTNVADIRQPVGCLALDPEQTRAALGELLMWKDKPTFAPEFLTGPVGEIGAAPEAGEDEGTPSSGEEPEASAVQAVPWPREEEGHEPGKMIDGYSYMAELQAVGGDFVHGFVDLGCFLAAGFKVSCHGSRFPRPPSVSKSLE